MYYVEDQDPILVKQEVQLNISELKRLYQEIIARFGKYVHRSYDAAFGPYAFQKSLEELTHIKNYQETPIGGEDANTPVADGFADSMEMMHYEYDEFVTPELAELVKRLLSGDVKAIREMKKGPVFHGNGTAKYAASDTLKNAAPDEERRARRELQDFLANAPVEMDAEKLQRLTERILRYYREDYAKEQREELREYYAKVNACIEFRPVMTLYKDKWNELRRVYKDVKAFYEGTGDFEEQFQQVMK
ncbi:MAG: hypothetical protein IKQ25_10780 [Lachnospiraceae bacterium]|nr:hypothetical protein [Lachnospiraceae bacterium]